MRVSQKFSIGGAQASLLQSNSALIATAKGGILVGCPPGIVKTILARKTPIPKCVVLTERFIQGIKVSVEPEFPFYASLFIGKEKPTFIGSRQAIERLKVILQETLLGPVDLPEDRRRIRDYFALKDTSGRPKSVAELADFRVFDGNQARFGDTVTIRRQNGRIKVLENNQLIGEVDPAQFTEPLFPLTPRPNFVLPLFGVTFIGTGAGFVVGKNTTSFVLWTDQGGVFVDPLANPNENLINNGIAPSEVRYIFLSHLHADHDAGVITKVLNGHKIDLITSPLIYGSLLRKLAAMTGRDMCEYINFLPADPGDSLSLGKTTLTVGRSLHSIPTVNFIAEHDGRRIAYSADTLYDPEVIADMYAQGVISPEFRDELLRFGDGADVLVHETGMPPLHSQWQKLAEKAGRVGKLLIVHTGPIPDLPPELSVAEEGSTVSLLDRPEQSQADRLTLLKRNFLFSHLPDEALGKLLDNSPAIDCSAGYEIIKKGELGDVMYLVQSGMVQVVDNGTVLATFMPGDLFGEVSLFLGTPRTASVIALTNAALIPINRAQFETHLASEKTSQALERLIASRPFLAQLDFAQNMSAATIAQLAARCMPVTFSRGQELIQEGKAPANFYVLVNGTAEVTIDGQKMAGLKPGSAFGEIALLNASQTTASVKITSPQATVLVMRAADFQALCSEIPSLKFVLTQMGAERREQSFVRMTHAFQRSLPPTSPRRDIGHLDKTLENLAAGRVSTLSVLRAAESWLNRIREKVFDPRLPTTARPGSGTDNYDFPFGLFPAEEITLFGAEQMPAWLTNHITRDGQTRMYLHPTHYLYSTGEIKGRFPGRDRAQPSSSFRTMFLLDPELPLAVKTHFPFQMGRYERRLTPSSAEHSRLVSQLLAQIVERGSPCPADFAFFPEYGAADRSSRIVPGGFGNVYRDLTPYPVISEGSALYPFFALYTPDVRFLDQSQPPLLVQLIEKNRGPAQSGPEYFAQEIWRKLLSDWSYFAFEAGVLLEPHGQNLLAELDLNGRMRRFDFRDFQSCMVDIQRLKANGLFSDFNKHILGSETPAEVSLSLVYDHYMGHYMVDPIVAVLSNYYKVEKAAIVETLRNTAREVLGNNLERFPKRGLRHDRSVLKFDDNQVSLEDGGPPRYR
jgi:CRP-like cAMP-binding protein